MLMDLERAQYLLAVVTAYGEGKLGPELLTDRCPECNEVVNCFDRDHILIDRGNGNPPAVIIACEEYWVIDPAAVGIPRNNWSDWRKLPFDPTSENFND